MPETWRRAGHRTPTPAACRADVADLVRTLPSQLGDPGVALLMLAETVFLPIPCELVIPLAGMQADRGDHRSPE